MNESFESMEQAEFEKAISAYTDKIVEENSKLVMFVMNKSIPTETINRKGEVIGLTEKQQKEHDLPPPRTLKPKTTGRPRKQVVTPLGRFDDIDQASSAYGISVKAMRGRLRYSVKCGYNEYYMVD